MGRPETFTKKVTIRIQSNYYLHRTFAQNHIGKRKRATVNTDTNIYTAHMQQ